LHNNTVVSQVLCDMFIRKTVLETVKDEYAAPKLQKAAVINGRVQNAGIDSIGCKQLMLTFYSAFLYNVRTEAGGRK